MKTFTYNLARRIETLIDLGVPIAKISRKWGVSRQSIYVWMKRIEMEDKQLLDNSVK